MGLQYVDGQLSMLIGRGARMRNGRPPSYNQVPPPHQFNPQYIREVRPLPQGRDGPDRTGKGERGMLNKAFLVVSCRAGKPSEESRPPAREETAPKVCG